MDTRFGEALLKLYCADIGYIGITLRAFYANLLYFAGAEFVKFRTIIKDIGSSG